MKCRVGVVAIAAIVIAAWCQSLALAQPAISTYEAKFTSAAPTIDGTVGAGEWDGANPGSNWYLLETPGDADPFGSKMQVMWDDTALYMLVTTNLGAWASPPPVGFIEAMDFNTYSMILYIDPNADGDYPTNPDPSAVFDTVDGYQIAYNVYQGSFACGQDAGDVLDDCSQPGGNFGSTFGTFKEAHVDALWGNHAEWEGMRATEIAMNSDANGSVQEIK
ncbi:MAG: hypothetical protein KDA99_00285, partial [Planctomycetales bacterium]|nr:hypothetical protein [Planctomycetales bacterium]